MCSIPGKRLLGLRINVLRRMHRKIAVIDGEVAFVGGINYSADHLADYGPEAKQDYSVEIHGPLVAEIHRFTHLQLAQGHRYQRPRQWWRYRSSLRSSVDSQPHVGTAAALLVFRDNGEHQGRHREAIPHRHSRGAQARDHRQRLLLPGLPLHARIATGCAARRRRAPDPAGRARHGLS